MRRGAGARKGAVREARRMPSRWALPRVASTSRRAAQPPAAPRPSPVDVVVGADLHRDLLERLRAARQHRPCLRRRGAGGSWASGPPPAARRCAGCLPGPAPSGQAAQWLSKQPAAAPPSPPPGQPPPARACRPAGRTRDGGQRSCPRARWRTRTSTCSSGRKGSRHNAWLAPLNGQGTAAAPACGREQAAAQRCWRHARVGGAGDAGQHLGQLRLRGVAEQQAPVVAHQDVAGAAGRGGWAGVGKRCVGMAGRGRGKKAVR